jgi:LuxR family transcriptional regulator, maltose regulon positive regulatory protein
MLQVRTGGYPDDVSAIGGLLHRGDLLERLDAATTKRVTVISAPAGSGKTSLLRAWADRAAGSRRVAFVSVGRDEHSAERFWRSVLDAIRGPTHSSDPDASPTSTASSAWPTRRTGSTTTRPSA